MKKTSTRIREEIAKLQEVLKAAETREAERIGRIALKAGLGEIEIEDGVLQGLFEDMVKRFRASPDLQAAGAIRSERQSPNASTAAPVPSREAQSQTDEA